MPRMHIVSDDWMKRMSQWIKDRQEQVASDHALFVQCGFEIECLMRERDQLIELLDDAVECDIIRCRHGYYMEEERVSTDSDTGEKHSYTETVYPSSFPCVDGRDGQGRMFDPDDPDYSA